MDIAQVFAQGLVPLAGGHSGEAFLVGDPGADGETAAAVVRIYGENSAWRGPAAVEIDAAVLAMVSGLIPTPEVLEMVRPNAAGTPGLLLTRYLPQPRLDTLLPYFDACQQRRVGANLGTLLGRLAHMVQPGPGVFVDASLQLAPMPSEYADPAAAWTHLRERFEFDATRAANIEAMANDAAALLDSDPRWVLVHSDFNPKNLLVDPDSLDVVAVIDWEYAHAGSAYTDLGNLLRFGDYPEMETAAVDAYQSFLPTPVDHLHERARAADFTALVELASRAGQNPVADRARSALMRRLGE